MTGSTHIGSLLIGAAFLTLAGCGTSQSSDGEQPEPAEWVVLFPDQDWNDFAPEQVQTFEGVVLYEAEDPLPSYVQRHNEYKLGMEDGTIDIYMGSSDELRPFIGRRIEIRGVIVDMEVEGQYFVEIWPTEYRPLP
ncbi:hypothetical protein JW921_06335 [Candidatus Fermentibacterales bacterium]|nr:hypothetical protein [Candidatus Fermentibacterales bacterium]